MKGLRDYLTRRALGYLLIVLIAGILSGLGIGSARAQDYTNFSSCTDTNFASAGCPDPGAAHKYADATARAKFPSAVSYCFRYETVGSQNTTVAYSAATNAACTMWQGTYTRTYPNGASCASRSIEHSWVAPDPVANPAQTVCYEGCTYKAYEDTSSGETFFTTLNDAGDDDRGTCTTGPAPVEDRDGDGIPDLDDDFPDDPSESTDTDGDGIGDNADFSPDDPTDGDDDGTGDETDNTASGGGTCDAPPVCNGDGIQCAQLHTQWKIMCKGANVTGSPEVCTANYTCTGDSAQCAQIALLRKTACATGSAGSGGPVGDTNQNGIPDAAEGPIADVGGPEPGVVDGNGEGDGLWGQIDGAGWLGGGACPGFPQITVASMSLDVGGVLCDQGAVLAGLLYTAALVAAAYVIGQALSGT